MSCNLDVKQPTGSTSFSETEDDNSTTEDGKWIAIEPPQTLRHRPDVPQELDPISELPPSFLDARFDIILRRQRMRPQDGSGLKQSTLPSRFLNLSNNFEFAGWGTLTRLELGSEDRRAGEDFIQDTRRRSVLGQFTASALAGNAVLGSVFYALPAVVAVSSVYSPISLFIATLVLFLWRPVMEELGSALPISGAPYTYILNVSTKSFALIGAALLLLDFASTVIVSAATAASYLAGEVVLPFPTFVGALLVLVIFTFISLSGVKESARIALGVLSFHIGTMIVLMISAAVHWGRSGMGQITENWNVGQAPSGRAIARQVFYGFCLGMLGLTGFECTPSYIGRIKRGQLPHALRNLHIPAIILNSSVMVLVLAVVPLDTILQGVNVLSVLAQMSAGRWLRIWIVIDAIIVLCGGVLTGILSACELLEQLAHDRVIPELFLRNLPKTNSPYVSVLFFVAFSGMLYASAAADLVVISQMFSLVWLTVMSLFPMSLLLLKFNRGRLTRHPETPLSVILAALAISAVVFAGNIAIEPVTVAYFAAYFFGIVFIFSASQNKVHLLRWIYWIYDQYTILHVLSLTKNWGISLVNLMTNLKCQPVCILAKTDEINDLFHMILYVRKNEETSCIKIIHFEDEEKGIPSELEANAKILDEAFPEITIDLVIVKGAFEPVNVIGLAHRLQITPSLMFMSCPGHDFPYSVAEFGTRIISL